MSWVGAIDLHTHSTLSDGTETPAELVASAAAAGLSAVALTDHDTTAGWDEAVVAARAAGVGLIPGIELSTRTGWRSVHVLGYLLDPRDPALVAELDRIRRARRDRARRIVERIAVDHPLTWDDVLAETSPGSTVGRPHIADALVARGIEPTRSAAFEGVLHWRRGYVEPHYAPTPVDGVRLIVDAGGVAVLAHPGAAGRGRELPAEAVAELAAAGLFGLERDHPENAPGGADHVDALAVRFGLAVTGASDYHGAGKRNRIGERVTDPAVVARILELGSGAAALAPSTARR